MKPFDITSDMLTLGGVFYPTGYAVVMFPTAEAAQQAATALDSQLGEAGEVMLLSASTVLSQIGKVDGESDVELPSVGTEGATVQKYVKLAREGHHAIMVKTPSSEVAEAVMVEARKGAFSYAQRYHFLAMEDLV
jgi:hypothetical protein